MARPRARPTNHLVIFVKAPQVAAVKTRLAREAGAVAAWQFYRRTTARLIARVARDPRWRCWLAVTPDRFARGPGFWPGGVDRAPQGTGDLGRRMARVFRALPPGPAVIVGSDIPALGCRHVAAAFKALRRDDVVFGPAADGGYWLIGLRRTGPSFPRKSLFTDVRWSSPHALADTRANLPRAATAAWLETLIDVDCAADLARWRRVASRDAGAPRLV